MNARIFWSEFVDVKVQGQRKPGSRNQPAPTKRAAEAALFDF